MQSNKLSQTKLDYRLFTLCGVFVGALVISGCMAAPIYSPTANHTVTLAFDVSGCPTGYTLSTGAACLADPGKLCVKRTQFVKWQTKSTADEFKVYFDPFVGPPYASRASRPGPGQETRGIKIASDAPAGDYKYGVIGLRCPDPFNNPLDPPLRVDH